MGGRSLPNTPISTFDQQNWKVLPGAWEAFRSVGHTRFTWRNNDLLLQWARNIAPGCSIAVSVRAHSARRLTNFWVQSLSVAFGDPAKLDANCKFER